MSKSFGCLWLMLFGSQIMQLRGYEAACRKRGGLSAVKTDLPASNASSAERILIGQLWTVIVVVLLRSFERKQTMACVAQSSLVPPKEMWLVGWTYLLLKETG